MNELTVVTNAIDIQVELIPESEIEGIARAVLDVADKIMSRPGVRKDYEKWKREYQSRKRCEGK